MKSAHQDIIGNNFCEESLIFLKVHLKPNHLWNFFTNFELL